MSNDGSQIWTCKIKRRIEKGKLRPWVWDEKRIKKNQRRGDKEDIRKKENAIT